MSAAAPVVTTALALLAFAANSLLCRLALQDGGTDAASFTAIRLASGALVLALLLAMRRDGGAPRAAWRGGHWRGGVALFAYAAGFSLAYAAVGAATGALLLFGAVQATMLVIGLWQGERLAAMQWLGFAFAVIGLMALLLPGAAAPPIAAALWMLGAGMAWGAYSLWGRGSADPVADTAGNFVRALPFAAGFVLAHAGALRIDATGLACGVASGALASGLGYVAWYAVLPRLGALRAAALQLAVPAITAVAAVLLLGETLDAIRTAAGVVILGGIALVLRSRALRNTTSTA